MNKKNILLTLGVVAILVVFMLVPNVTLATMATTPLYLGITELRTNDTPNMGYAIGDPNTNGETGMAAKLWNIVKYSSSTSNDPTEADIYCVKAGVGFSDTKKRATYNVFFDMKTERDQIKAQNNVLKSIVEGTIPVDETNSVGKYDALLALGNMLYLVQGSTEEDKIAFLEKAGIYEEEWDTLMTSDEISAVQQAAMWYFTNYYKRDESAEDYAELDVHDEKYDKTSSTGWLNYTLDGVKYDSLSKYNPTGVAPNDGYGSQRQAQAEILYKYLIKTAKENANKYTDVSKLGAPAKVNTKTLNYKEDGANYIIGPINITEQEGNTIPYTIDFIVKNDNTEITNYKLLDSNQSEVSAGTEVNDLVGEDFYISVPKESVTSISVAININYSNTKLTLWASTTNNQEQPVMIPEKERVSVPVELTVTPNEKIFDLALRKYITKVNDVELEQGSSRVPVIDESTLTSGTTATYKHKKDPVVIQTGDKVTYKITIYNEGEKEGRATKIVDQLPTGLKFVKVVSGNFEEESYSEADNKLNLTRKVSNTDNLPAYTKGNLSSETIEIECEVTLVPDKVNSKILTNVAWISEAIDSESNITITNQVGADRDSEPSTVPNVNKDNMENYAGNDNKSDLADSNYYYKGQQDDDDFEKLVLMPESFDLKLIKRIVAVNNQNVPERIQNVDVSKLNTIDIDGKLVTTGEYKLNKEPVSVAKGDIVTYTFRIYNEGTIDGYASEITEDIPEGLEFIWSEKEGEDLANDTTLTEEEKEAIEFNQKYLWGNFQYDENKEKIIQISTDYLSKENETTVDGNLIPAFGKNDGTKTESDISYKEVSVKLKVVSEDVTGTIIRNEACISEDTDKAGNTIDDRDSDTETWVKYEDDEDYDNIILKSFDLALRKFIIALSKDITIDNDEYLKNEDGSYTRAPIVDTSKLNTLDENNKVITTAIYNHTKEPVTVNKNDIVVYMLRVYNEGEIDGYAAEIKDHLPPYLEFVEGDFNTQYGWQVSEDGRTVTTNYLGNEKISKASTEDGGEIVLSYKEVPIMCKVKEEAKASEEITNIADITKYLDENRESVVDRDSVENNVQLPTDENLPGYKDNETGEYIPGQEDDDDFEKVIIQKFDLALRKFITAIDDKEVTTRVPQVKYENEQITYEHTKEPMQVVTNNIVTYTIRVYNEGEVDGYAQKITDDIPEGLEFLPDNELNKTMRWKMIDEEGNETTDLTKAVKITTDYLSKEQESEEYGNLLKAFDKNQPIGEENPDYKDVQVAFKVVEPNSSDKIIINSAQISEDSDKEGNPIDDEDSIPDEWNEGEDDQDREYIKLVEFDLALRKWVTQAIVIENGQETITNTGHGPYDDPEQVVKVELHRKKLNEVTVKFRYSIRVINEGDIAGYAKEVTDYIPAGLKFVAEDNPGWTDEGNNVISTRMLENTLLQPGEYADVEVVLTWVNSQDNMGVMTNIAEISEDENEYGVPDRDSTPDNQKEGEDDIDDAPVMLSVSTGQIRIYFTLGFIILVTIAVGVILIKKYVL